MDKIHWKRARKNPRLAWTATVGNIFCGISPPDDNPLGYHWWYTDGPAPYWKHSGGAPTLKQAQRMVAEAIEEGAKKASQDPANITNLSKNEVGI